ncbi:MAG: rRNA maturation RNase YbeY [Patescibacteria group bacterium]|nr:rRNA maturation RNase YbeY [Patescibacteria group bacterium]
MIYISFDYTGVEIDQDTMKIAINKAFDVMQKSDYNFSLSDIDLYFIGDTEMIQLNTSWRGKESSTDILSFPAEGEGISLDSFVDPEIDTQEPSMGELFISLDVAQKQADQWGHDIYNECQLLFVHGVLHLLGYDHELGEKEEQEMFDTQNKIMEIIEKP